MVTLHRNIISHLNFYIVITEGVIHMYTCNLCHYDPMPQVVHYVP